MSTYADFKDLLTHLIDPWRFMSISARHIPSLILTLLLNGQFTTLLSPWSFRDVLFGDFWAVVGPQVKMKVEERVIPLLEGRIKGAEVQEIAHSLPVSGRVIEVGAGSGMWADVFSKVGGGSEEVVDGVRKRGVKPGSGLTKIYGVEPNATSAKALREKVKEVGLGDIYEVIPVGIESLSDPSAWSGTTIEPGSIDCIVSILCLCSIPDQEKNVKALYDLLKPGGRWYVFEHVKADRGGILFSLYQRKHTHMI